MNTLLKVLGGVLLRAGVLVAGSWVYHRAWIWAFYGDTGEEAIGADIGEGLVAFALVALITAIWGAYDGHRQPFVRVIALWVGTGIALGLAAVARNAAEGSLESVAADLAVLTPFLVGLVAVPALCGAAITASIKGSQIRAER